MPKVCFGWTIVLGRSTAKPKDAKGSRWGCGLFLAQGAPFFSPRRSAGSGWKDGNWHHCRWQTEKEAERSENGCCAQFFFSAGCLKWSKWCQWIDCTGLVGIPPGDDLFRLGADDAIGTAKESRKIDPKQSQTPVNNLLTLQMILNTLVAAIEAGIGSPRAPGRSLCPAPVSTLHILGPSVGFEVQQGGLQEAIPAIPAIPRYTKMGIVRYGKCSSKRTNVWTDIWNIYELIHAYDLWDEAFVTPKMTQIHPNASKCIVCRWDDGALARLNMSARNRPPLSLSKISKNMVNKARPRWLIWTMSWEQAAACALTTCFLFSSFFQELWCETMWNQCNINVNIVNSDKDVSQCFILP